MADAFGNQSQLFIDEMETLRSTIYHLSEGVIVADREGKIPDLQQNRHIHSGKRRDGTGAPVMV